MTTPGARAVPWSDPVGVYLPGASASNSDDYVRANGRALSWDDLGPILDGHYTAVQPGILRRDNRSGLFYPRKKNLLFGDDWVGKTWVMLVAASQVLARGGDVFHLDWDDIGETMVERLQLLNVDSERVRARYHHMTDPGAFTRRT